MLDEVKKINNSILIHDWPTLLSWTCKYEYTFLDCYELIKWCGFNNQALHVLSTHEMVPACCIQYIVRETPFTLFSSFRGVYNLWLNLFFSEIACKPRLFIRSESSLYISCYIPRDQGKRSVSWLPMINLAVIDFSRQKTDYLFGWVHQKTKWANEAIKCIGKFNKTDQGRGWWYLIGFSSRNRKKRLAKTLQVCTFIIRLLWSIL